MAVWIWGSSWTCRSFKPSRILIERSANTNSIGTQRVGTLWKASAAWQLRLVMGPLRTFISCKYLISLYVVFKVHLTHRCSTSFRMNSLPFWCLDWDWPLINSFITTTNGWGCCELRPKNWHRRTPSCVQAAPLQPQQVAASIVAQRCSICSMFMHMHMYIFLP